MKNEINERSFPKMSGIYHAYSPVLKNGFEVSYQRL